MSQHPYSKWRSTESTLHHTIMAQSENWQVEIRQLYPTLLFLFLDYITWAYAAHKLVCRFHIWQWPPSLENNHSKLLVPNLPVRLFMLPKVLKPTRFCHLYGIIPQKMHSSWGENWVVHTKDVWMNVSCKLCSTIRKSTQCLCVIP